MADWPYIPDLSGNAYHGVATNMEQSDIALDSPGGTFSRKSFVFGGTDELVSVGDVLDFDRLEPLSISFWIKAGAIVGAPNLTVIGKLDAAPEFEGWEVYIDNVGHVVFQLVHDVSAGTPDMLQVYGNTTTWRNSAWHHFAITYSGSGAASGVLFYLDGSPLGGVTNNDNLTGSTLSAGVLALGARLSDSSGYLTASLDEPAVYSDVLTAGEVAWIYNSGSPYDLLDGSAPGNLEGWWRADAVSWPASVVDYTDLAPIPQEEDDHGQVLAWDVGGGGPTITTYYKMRASQSVLPLPSYVTWVVSGAPDFDGSVGYSGGTPTPSYPMLAGSAVVVATWEE